MIWLLGWLFPWLLLVLARRRGSVMLQSVEGVGWQCIIRPPYEQGRGVNAWTSSAPSAAGSLRGALRVARANETVDHSGSRFAPKLGGREFDDE